MDEACAVPSEAQRAILDWYATAGRSLAFRRTSDPYAVLVSEAIAQQTQAARAADRWERFMARFPTVEALAAATLAEVLREWQGLGYDRRGMNLWRAARVIVREHGGRVPSDVATLETLPGVGPYTARAVAAIAYGLPVGAVDTNVRRVLTRVLIGEEAAAPTSRQMQAIADASVPVDAAAAWTHALMDLGATLCRAGRTECAPCPARAWCRSAAIGAKAVTTPGRSRTGARARPAATPFPATNRWLRGRLMDRLRAAPGDAFIQVAGPIGVHGGDAVDRALEALARDGLVERRPDGLARLRMG